MNLQFTTEEMQDYFTKLHKRIHWLLVYKEEEFPALNMYFKYVIFQLYGLREIFPNNYRIMDLIVLIEAAKVESQKNNYSHKLYRKAILDAHGVINELEKSLVNE